MKSVDKLVDIIKTLRAPNGCPWDREQTHKTIRGHLVEECAEVIEAIDLECPEKIREELGDLLMHIALHAEIASEQNQFSLDDIVNELNEKIVRRHPHVFGDSHVDSSDEVWKIWEKVKAQEKKERVVGKMFDGIPPTLSSLRYALDIAKKTDVNLLSEVDETLSEDDKSVAIGKELFDVVRKAVSMKIEPEGALRDYIAKIKKFAQENNL